MKILLIGEYSRLHWTLAEGLRALGHEVLVASDGDGFKNYPRDVDLTRKSSSLIDTATSLLSVFSQFSKFKGYDVVQVINPCFTAQNMHINTYLYAQLKRYNKRVFLGAFGDDSYWVRACMEKKIFNYSEFWVDGRNPNEAYTQKLIATWINSYHEQANRKMAQSANGIVACLYEYYKAYEPFFADPLTYIPLPVNTDSIAFTPLEEVPSKLHFFIGINSDRNAYKGTDVMERAVLHIGKKYPQEVIVTQVASIEYAEYTQRMAEAHVVLDQLYSHSPAMNALLAMAQGKVLVGGGDPKMYDLLGESDNRPIVDVFPSEEDVFEQLEQLVLHKDTLPQRALAGRQFVEKHHNYIRVAQQYIDWWSKK